MIEFLEEITRYTPRIRVLVDTWEASHPGLSHPSIGNSWYMVYNILWSPQEATRDVTRDTKTDVLHINGSR